jgi:hypothetical protein
MFSADGERQILPRQTKSNLQDIGILFGFLGSCNNDHWRVNLNFVLLLGKRYRFFIRLIVGSQLYPC